jgi:UDP-N-acetylmuramoylalanine--D-glutamate ligase
MRITQNQGASDFFIFSADDETTQQMLTEMDDTLRARQLPFAINTAIASGDGDAVLEGHTFTATVGKKSVTVDTRKMQIQGMHNIYNAMSAALATLAAGVEPKTIKRSIYDFSPVEHRLEPAGTANDIEWVNDSKATNVDSVWYALESMQRPTVWIAGGTDKGNDYTPIKEFARRKVKALICMGVDNEKLKREFKDVVPVIRDCNTFEDAMKAAKEEATAGDTVLLSPACASFDLFRNYEERGRMFKEWVKSNVIEK